MAEEVCSFQDEYGTTNIAIGNESFSKRYQINKSKVFPCGITLIDFNKILEIKKREKMSKNPFIVEYMDVNRDETKRDYHEEHIQDDGER